MGMNKVNKNLIFALLILGIAFNLTVFLPSSAEAYVTQGAYTYCDGPCVGGTTYNGGNANKNIPSPVIYSLSPNKTDISAKTGTVTIKGTGFRPDSIARWNSTDRPTSYVNSSKLIMDLDPEDTKKVGKYLVTVVNPTPDGGNFSNGKIFTLTNDATNTGTVSKKSSKTTATTLGATLGGGTGSSTISIVDGDEDTNSKLTASAISGSRFMPSTLLGWLIILALLFLLVWLWVKIRKADEERVAPLKHA